MRVEAQQMTTSLDGLDHVSVFQSGGGSGTYTLYMCLCEENDPNEWTDDFCQFHSTELNNPAGPLQDAGCGWGGGEAGPETCQLSGREGCVAPGGGS